MRKCASLKRSSICVCLAMVWSAPCFAGGFVNSGAAWIALSPDAKAAYVQGLNDGMNVILPTDDLAIAITKVARTRCLAEQRTTSAVLADRITQGYASVPGLKGQPPAVVYLARMFLACRDIINQERDRFGLMAL